MGSTDAKINGIDLGEDIWAPPKNEGSEWHTNFKRTKDHSFDV